jgi:hypothetical protein
MRPSQKTRLWLPVAQWVCAAAAAAVMLLPAGVCWLVRKFRS